MYISNPIVAGTINSTSAELDIYTIAASLDYRPLISSDTKNLLLQWGDIVKSVDIFISAPLYTYDMSGKCESLANYPTSGADFYGKYNPVKVSENENTAYRNYLIWSLHYRIAEEYTADYTGGQCIALPSFSTSEINTKIRDCGEFYFLSSIEIKDLPISSYERPLVPIEDS